MLVRTAWDRAGSPGSVLQVYEFRIPQTHHLEILSTPEAARCTDGIPFDYPQGDRDIPWTLPAPVWTLPQGTHSACKRNQKLTGVIPWTLPRIL